MGRYLHRALFAAVLLFFFAVPICLILYGGAAAAIFGLTLIGILILIQAPAFFLIKRAGLLPTSKRDDV